MTREEEIAKRIVVGIEDFLSKFLDDWEAANPGTISMMSDEQVRAFSSRIVLATIETLRKGHANP